MAEASGRVGVWRWTMLVGLVVVGLAVAWARTRPTQEVWARAVPVNTCCGDTR